MHVLQNERLANAVTSGSSSDSRRVVQTWFNLADRQLVSCSLLAYRLSD